MSSVVLSGDSSGTVTLTVPSAAGTNTATLPAATGTVMVSGNMPAFSAYLSSNQSVSSNVWTKIAFDTELFDTNNNFASSRFTPTVAGYYQINSTVEYTGTLNSFGISIYKNGSEYSRGVNGGVVMYATSVSNIVYCNGSTDYIEIYAYCNTGSFYGAGSPYTWVTGSMIRGA